MARTTSMVAGRLYLSCFFCSGLCGESLKALLADCGTMLEVPAQMPGDDWA